jgi:hypothetical protein
MIQIKYLIQLISFVVWVQVFFPCYTYSQGSSYIHLEGKQFVDEFEDNFFPKVCNYYLQICYDNTSTFIPPPVYITPHAKNNGTGYSDCQNFPACDTEIIRDFNEIFAMGFNSVRLVGLTPKMEFDVSNVVSGLFFTARAPENWNDSILIHFDVSSIETPDLSTYNWRLVLGMYDQLMVEALSVLSPIDGKPLKVIWQLGGIYDFYTPQSIALYEKFMAQIVKHLQNKTNLLAYDLFNEPSAEKNFSNGFYPTKTWVCELIGRRYDLVQANDTNHLITLGGWGAHDVFTFDPNILKVDFYSLHLYPEVKAHGFSSFQEGWNKVMAEIYWLAKSCNKPIIIGETGFSCLDGYGAAEQFDGTVAEMETYMENSLNAMIDCSYSGFSVWWFQDPVVDPLPNAGIFYGLLRSGVPPIAPLRKSGVSKIQSFTYNTLPPPGLCLPPPNYSNPKNFDTTNPLTGSLEDQNESSIQNAYLYGWGQYHDDDAGWQLFGSYTFTDEVNLDFSLNKKASNPGFSSFFKNLRISAPGHSVRWFGSWTPPHDLPTSGNTYTLTDYNYDYDELINNQNIPSAFSKVFKGWNSLEVNNTTVEGFPGVGGSLDLVARNEIIVYEEFYAKNGSEVHIFCDDTWMNCPTIVNFNRRSFPLANNVTSSGESEIELKFITEVFNDISTYPNPSSGTFSIRCPKGFPFPLDYSVFNSYGNLINSGLFQYSDNIIDLSNEPPGLYLLSISSQDQHSTIKLILQ